MSEFARRVAEEIVELGADVWAPLEHECGEADDNDYFADIDCGAIDIRVGFHLEEIINRHLVEYNKRIAGALVMNYKITKIRTHRVDLGSGPEFHEEESIVSVVNIIKTINEIEVE